jgi:hypothetical protein
MWWPGGRFCLQKNGGAGLSGYGHPGRRRDNNRTTMAQRDEVIRRTVYVSDIDHQVSARIRPGSFLSRLIASRLVIAASFCRI